MRSILSIGVVTSALIMLFTGCDQGPFPEDPIKVPGQAFLSALLQPGLDEHGELQIIDTNDDGVISYAEAEAITFLDVSNFGITDMRGIERFINLKYLRCSDNQITKLDISRNPALEHLYC